MLSEDLTLEFQALFSMQLKYQSWFLVLNLFFILFFALSLVAKLEYPHSMLSRRPLLKPSLSLSLSLSEFVFLFSFILGDHLSLFCPFFLFKLIHTRRHASWSILKYRFLCFIKCAWWDLMDS